MEAKARYSSHTVVSLKLSLFIVILAVSVVTSITLYLYYISDTRDTVIRIQQTSEAQFNDLGLIVAEGLNDDGKLELSELLLIEQNVKTDRDTLVPKTDFAANDLDKINLGF